MSYKLFFNDVEIGTASAAREKKVGIRPNTHHPENPWRAILIDTLDLLRTKHSLSILQALQSTSFTSTAFLLLATDKPESIIFYESGFTPPKQGGLTAAGLYELLNEKHHIQPLPPLEPVRSVSDLGLLMSTAINLLANKRCHDFLTIGHAYSYPLAALVLLNTIQDPQLTHILGRMGLRTEHIQPISSRDDKPVILENLTQISDSQRKAEVGPDWRLDLQLVQAYAGIQ